MKVKVTKTAALTTTVVDSLAVAITRTLTKKQLDSFLSAIRSGRHKEIDLASEEQELLTRLGQRVSDLSGNNFKFRNSGRHESTLEN